MTPTLSTPVPLAVAAPASRPWGVRLRASVRRLTVVDFPELDGLDLGPAAELDREVEALFSRGPHVAG